MRLQRFVYLCPLSPHAGINSLVHLHGLSLFPAVAAMMAVAAITAVAVSAIATTFMMMTVKDSLKSGC